MFSKLAVLILSVGAVAAMLLAARQQRLYAVHNATEAMRRIAEHDRTLWRLRSEIAEKVTPDQVRKLTNRFGPMVHFYSWPSPDVLARLKAGPQPGDGRIVPASTLPPAPAAKPSHKKVTPTEPEEHGPPLPPTPDELTPDDQDQPDGTIEEGDEP